MFFIKIKDFFFWHYVFYLKDASKSQFHSHKFLMPSLESVKFTEENGNVSQVLTPNNGDASTSTFVDSTPIQDESFSKNLPICESDASFPSVTLKQERLHCIYRE
uniref:Uncharacterized protein n=1 Tax=Meloidogyne enterolobii TaxID=390850 RepID=A0A6V7XF54_MELEN|nr:unnamed protein product [Meloidogyne enterolobii]